MSEYNVKARDEKTSQVWREELKILARGLGLTPSDLKGFLFLDAELAEGFVKTPEVETLILIVDEKNFVPESESLMGADDLLVYPFRMAELLSVVRHHHLRLSESEMIAEIEATHAEMNQVNATLERILEAKSPKRYTGIKGIQVMSKHLAGLKPGGDYFDVFESEKKDFVNFLMVDSSSYGISAALLGMLLSSSARIASDSKISTADWVRAIHSELKVTLGEGGHFSVFFGRLNRRDFSLHYQLYGSIDAFIVDKSGDCHPIEKHGARVSSLHNPEAGFESVIHLNPKDRIVLLSDGFVGGIGGEFTLQKIFRDRMEQHPFTLVNELSFQIKKKLSPGETFPGEDCSAIVIDIESRVLRLAI